MEKQKKRIKKIRLFMKNIKKSFAEDKNKCNQLCNTTAALNENRYPCHNRSKSSPQSLSYEETLEQFQNKNKKERDRNSFDDLLQITENKNSAKKKPYIDLKIQNSTLLKYQPKENSTIIEEEKENCTSPSQIGTPSSVFQRSEQLLSFPFLNASVEYGILKRYDSDDSKNLPQKPVTHNRNSVKTNLQEENHNQENSYIREVDFTSRKRSNTCENVQDSFFVNEEHEKMVTHKIAKNSAHHSHMPSEENEAFVSNNFFSSRITLNSKSEDEFLGNCIEPDDIIEQQNDTVLVINTQNSEAETFPPVNIYGENNVKRQADLVSVHPFTLNSMSDVVPNESDDTVIFQQKYLPTINTSYLKTDEKSGDEMEESSLVINHSLKDYKVLFFNEVNKFNKKIEETKRIEDEENLRIKLKAFEIINKSKTQPNNGLLKKKDEFRELYYVNAGGDKNSQEMSKFKFAQGKKSQEFQKIKFDSKKNPDRCINSIEEPHLNEKGAISIRKFSPIQNQLKLNSNSNLSLIKLHPIDCAENAYQIEKKIKLNEESNQNKFSVIFNNKQNENFNPPSREACQMISSENLNRVNSKFVTNEIPHEINIEKKMKILNQMKKKEPNNQLNTHSNNSCIIKSSDYYRKSEREGDSYAKQSSQGDFQSELANSNLKMSNQGVITIHKFEKSSKFLSTTNKKRILEAIKYYFRFSNPTEKISLANYMEQLKKHYFVIAFKGNKEFQCLYTLVEEKYLQRVCGNTIYPETVTEKMVDKFFKFDPELNELKLLTQTNFFLKIVDAITLAHITISQIFEGITIPSQFQQEHIEYSNTRSYQYMHKLFAAMGNTNYFML